MITAEQAAYLRGCIEQYRDAEVAESFKGAGDPADAEQLVAERDIAKRTLEEFIHELEHGPRDTPTPLLERAP